MEEQKLLKKKHRLLKEGNKALLATVCNNLGTLYLREGNYDLAIQEYKHEASLFREMKNHMKYGIANRLIGEVYATISEFDKALKYQEIHLKVAREEKNLLEEQRALATIGRTHLTKAIDDEEHLVQDTLNIALKSFMKSIAICERLTDISKQEQMDMRARLMLNIGLVKESQGDYDKGTEYMMKSIQICKEYDIHDQLHQGYSTLGLLFNKKGDHKNAIAYLNLAFEVAKRLSDKTVSMCSTLFSKAEVLIKLADFQGAKTVLLKAQKLKTPNQEDREAIERNLKTVAAMVYTEDKLLTALSTDYKTKKKLYEKMGDGACQLKNYDKAIDYYKKMLECSEACGDTGRELLPVYVSLGQTYKDNKQYDLALDYFQKDYEISRDNPKDGCQSLLIIADVLELANRNYDEIASIYEKCRNFAQATGEMKIEGNVLTKFINVQKKYQKFNEAKDLEKELLIMGYVPSDDESELGDVEGTPEIGDDVNIDEITDVSDQSDNDELERTRNTRKRGKTFAVKKNNKGETQLHTACIAGNLELVKKLLDQNHPVNVRDHCGWLPLHEACICGHKEIVTLLLDKGAAINDRGGTLCHGMTPLHDAASNGHLEVIELMLDRGASPLAQTDKGETPLDILKDWRKLVDLDPIEQTYFETLIARMTNILEKAGRSTSNKTPKERESDAGRNSRSPKKSPSKLAIGDLRYSTDIDDNFGPSSSNSRRNSNQNDSRSFTRSFSPDYSRSLSPDYSRPLSPDYSRHLSPSYSPPLSTTYGENMVENSSEDDGKTRKEYQRVMDSLRKRAPETRTSKSPKNDAKKSALVNAEDDWLEDDIGINQPVKRRKTGLDIRQNYLNTSGIRSNTNLNSFALNKSVGSPAKINPGEISADEMNARESFSTDLEMTRENNANSINTINVSDESGDSFSSHFTNNSNSSKKRRTKSQLSLLDSGFSRRRSDSPSAILNSSAVSHVSRISNKSYKWQPKIASFGTLGYNSGFKDAHEPDSTTTTILDQNQILNSTLRSILALNVRIENRLWRIPIPANDIDTLTIGWLANEAAIRYYKKEGIKPTLQLETKEGAILENEDPLSMVFTSPSQPDEVQSSVVSWNLPPIPERYVEACRILKIDTNPKLFEHLDECQGTLNLNLCDFSLPKSEIVPLFRSLNRQTNLQSIDLSGNVLLNEGIQQLCLALPSLTQLRSLNLSLNNITGDGVRYLSEIFTNSTKPVLEYLTDLNLSFNLLGDESLSHLSVILRHTKLRILSLADCNLTQNIFENVTNRGVNLNFENLESLDISYNDLNSDSIIVFISFLNFSTIRNLNFSHNKCVTQSGIVNEFVVNLHQSDQHNIKSLNFARCKVNDNEVWELLRLLTNANDLDSLDLSYNEDLTSATLQRLIQHRPSFTNIRLEGCTNILKYIEIRNAIESNDFYQPSALKSLSISVNYEKDYIETDMLKSMCEKEWGKKARVEKMFGSFLHLSVND